MAGVPEKVLNWLYSVLPSEYADVNRTYHDVAEALSSYPSLSPRTEVYTYENGASALLLQLRGTLPVTFRGATYGFPVAIWVPHAYPRESPIVYVTPSQDMLVRPGQHVSGDGRIYHPYLAQWGKYWDKSTLFDFVAVLRGVFAKEPPVRSKQQQQQQYKSPAPPAPPPVPPPPAEWRRSTRGSQTESPAPMSASQAPPPPPKPLKPYDQSGGTPQPTQEGRYSRPPPLPPLPGQQQHQHPQPLPLPHRHAPPPENNYAASSNWQQPGPPPQDMPQRQPSYDMHSPHPASKPSKPHVYAPGVQNHAGNAYGVVSPVSPLTPEGQQSARYHRAVPPQQQHAPQPPHYRQQPPHYRQQPPPASQQQHVTHQSSVSQHNPHGVPTNYPPQHPYYQQQQPLPQHAPLPPKPPINLLDDSLEVTLPSQNRIQAPIPVPPVPPNPEKDALLRALSQTLCSQVRQTVSSNAAAIAPLRGQQVALQTAYSRLQAELDQLQQLDAALASNEKILKDTMLEADRVMTEARTRKVPDVDEVLVAPTVVGGQLYTLAAEERGIADALFVLGRALDKGRVGADVFVKQTRSLAREQFLKKALVKKISKGMALDEYGVR